MRTLAQVICSLSFAAAGVMMVMYGLTKADTTSDYQTLNAATLQTLPNLQVPLDLQLGKRETTDTVPSKCIPDTVRDIVITKITKPIRSVRTKVVHKTDTVREVYVFVAVPDSVNTGE